MNKKMVSAVVLGLFLVVMACNLPSILTSSNGEPVLEDQEVVEEAQPLAGEEPSQAEGPEESEGGDSDQPQPLPPSGDVISPEALVYLGAFRLPDEAGGSSWDYAGTALAYFPDGDPGGHQDGYPGSLFASGQDQTFEVAEISIPQPVDSRNLDDLPIAGVLQPFQDISAGLVDPGSMELPRFGLEYLPPQGGQSSGKLYFSVGQHFQEFEPSHGWREVDLTNRDVAGLWVFDGYANYTSNDYLFEIPREWADQYTPGQYLASGRAREGPWSGNGPALFAYGPWNDGNPPASGETITSITPLLLYGVQEPGTPEIITDESMAINGRMDCDHWLGGAWLTAGDKSALIFVGTKAVNRCWYGFANGVVWDYACAETNTCPEVPEWPNDDRGFWASDYTAQIMFFDPADLAAVVRGAMETWAPQPYAILDIAEYMYAPQIVPADYKRDITGAVAYDRANGLLYVMERLADGYKPLVHVWRVEQ